MSMKEFIAKFAEALELEDISVVNENTTFRDLDEWNSLSFLSVIAMLDEEYGIQIENAQFRELKTLGDIASYIESHK
ncbi:acyl carrier protein [Alistipes communis]|jgi:acyl carrier protein|nr:acyl carrier protein [Alistipes communis]